MPNKRKYDKQVTLQEIIEEEGIGREDIMMIKRTQLIFHLKRIQPR